MFSPDITKPNAPSRIAVDDNVVVIGDDTGTVRVCKATRWPSGAKSPMWSAQVHKGAISCVLIRSQAGFALTAGRDGIVYCHELAAGAGEVVDANDDAHRSRVVCRVSGEVRALALDDQGYRLFIGGDTLRYITLGERPSVTSTSFQIAAPIIAIAVSPCGMLVAVASGTTGDVLVAGLSPPKTDDASQQQPSLSAGGGGGGAGGVYPFATVRYNLKGLISKSRRNDEQSRLVMSWAIDSTFMSAGDKENSVSSGSASEAGAYLLAVPTEDGAKIFRFVLPQASSDGNKPSLYLVSTITVGSLRNMSAVCVVPHTKTDFTLMVCGTEEEDGEGGHANTKNENEEEEEDDLAALGKKTGGKNDPHVAAAYVLKCSIAKKSGKSSQQTIGILRCPSTIADVGIDMHAHGNVVLAGLGGELGLWSAAVPLPRKARGTGSGGGSTQQNEEEEDGKKEPEVATAAADKKASRMKHVVVGKVKKIKDDDEEPEAQSSSSSDADSASSAGSSSGGDSSETDEDEDSSDDAGDNGERHLGSVVDDLMRSKRHVLPEGSKRKSALRTHGTSQSTKADASGASSRRAVPSYLDDEAEEDDSDESDADDASHEDEASTHGQHRPADSEDEYDNVDDTASNDHPEEEEEGGRENNASRAAATIARDGHVQRQQHLAAPDYTFQPGSTPLRTIDGVASAPSCYFSYNSIGCIRSGSDGVVIQFHDISRPSIKLQERGRVIMASMGVVGSAFVLDVSGVVEDDAAAVAAAQDSPIRVYFRTYVALGAQADWKVPLLPYEACRCIAVGLRFVAVSTSVGLRLFSLSGLEIAVLCMPPRVVAMVGCNSSRLAQSLKYDEDPLVVVYRKSGTSEALEFTVLNCHTSQVVQPATALPLTPPLDPSEPDHFLTWIGWSDDGPLHTCDTAGVVRMFSKDWGGSWMPVFDPRHFTSDPIYTYWVWAVTDTHMMAYKSPKGAANYSMDSSGAFPVATAGGGGSSGSAMEQVRLCLPLLRVGPEKQLLSRERFIRITSKVNELKRSSTHYTPLIAKQDALHDLKLMELFKAALKEQQTSRAIDIATMFQLRDSIEDAAKLANQEGHKGVVSKLIVIIDARHKMKLKRLCTLPLEGQDVSDKERDQILRKLLLKEKQHQQQQQQQHAATSGGQQQEQQQPNRNRGEQLPSSTHAANHRTEGATSTTSSHNSSKVHVPTSFERRPDLQPSTVHEINDDSMAGEGEMEEAAAAMEAVVAPPPPPPQRRSIAFEDLPQQPTPHQQGPAGNNSRAPAQPKLLAASSSFITAPQAPPTFASVPKGKVQPPSFGGSARTPEGKSTVSAAENKTTAAASSSMQPTTNTVKARPSTTTTTILGGGSIPPNIGPSTPNRKPTSAPSSSSPPLPPPSPPTSSSAVVASSSSSSAPATSKQMPPAIARSPLKGSMKVHPVVIAAAALPSPFATPAPSFLDIPTDPFLSPGEDGTRIQQGGGLDVGHHFGALESPSATLAASSQAVVVPRTASFGEALRKRYREEEDDDE